MKVSRSPWNILVAVLSGASLFAAGSTLRARKRNRPTRKGSPQEQKSVLGGPCWEAAYDSVPEVILIVDEAGQIVYFNRLAQERMQGSASEWLGKSIDEFFGNRFGLLPHWWEEGVDRVWQPLLSGWFDVISHTLPEQMQLAGRLVLLKEVPEDSQAERSLRESEARFRSLFEKTKAAMLLIDPESGAILKANPAAIEFYDCSEEVLLSMNLDELNDWPRRLSVAQRRRALVEESLILELPQRFPNGVTRMVEIHLSTLKVKGKTPLLFAILHDVQQRFQVETELRQRTAELQAIFNALPDLFFRMDSHGILLHYYSNLSFSLFARPQEFLGKAFQEILPPDAALTLEQALKKAAQSRKTATAEYCLNDRIYVARLIPFLEGQFLGIVQDVTEARQLQERMVASQKMADLGTLAAGIAHEINTPLQVITGVSQSALDKMKEGGVSPERVQHSLESIHRSAWRCAEIVRSLRTYAHSTPFSPEPRDLNQVVQDTLLLMEHQLKNWTTIELQTDFAPELPSIPCDPGQMSQVLINLLTNAHDAMPNGGQIRLSTCLDRSNEWVLLEVADTGSGIPQAVQERIFDPFFTTKPVGEGVGLGLSIVLGIVQSHQAQIEVACPPSGGTVFTLRLPLRPNPLEANPSPFEELGRFRNPDSV